MSRTSATAKTPGASAKADAPAKKVVRLTGVVESDRRSKTRTVVVRTQSPHPKYGKYVTKERAIQAHDESNASKAGDTVEIVPCRPMSRTKKWTVARVVTSALSK